jgi:Spy/CpxP family protein refolding chaperone
MRYQNVFLLSVFVVAVTICAALLTSPRIGEVVDADILTSDAATNTIPTNTVKLNTTASTKAPPTNVEANATTPKPPKPTPSNETTMKTPTSQYNIEQATSDKAQLSTLAFDGLGFLTGNLCSDSFLPPGKVADFFGFQYLRDTTQAGMGHSTDFVTNAANNVLSILTPEQKAKMIALAKSQASTVNEYAEMRYPLMVAFRRQLTGDLPAGTSLNKEQVMNYSATIYQLDAEISIQRAQLFADIINSLNTEQRAYLDEMVEGGFQSWSPLEDQIDKTSLTHDEHVLVMTYASEMLGWYAGNIEADTYFCPERQADYFGGFYIKDAPAIGNAGYTIDETITADKGEAFLQALSETQKPVITSLVEQQRTALNEIIEKRRAISTELRKALTTGEIDEEKVLALGREYGELDGEISYYYATAFAEVGKTLTTTQEATLMKIRDLDAFPVEDDEIYLFSQKIDLTEIPDTDFLFK